MVLGSEPPKHRNTSSILVWDTTSTGSAHVIQISLSKRMHTLLDSKYRVSWEHGTHYRWGKNPHYALTKYPSAVGFYGAESTKLGHRCSIHLGRTKLCWVSHDVTDGSDHPEVNVGKNHARRQNKCVQDDRISLYYLY